MNEKDFKLTDYCKPVLEEGKYTIKGIQTVTSPAIDNFSISKDFYVATNAQKLSPETIFSVYPALEQQGNFSGTLPFMVLNNQVYPWLHHWTDDRNGFPVPWLALIVIAENESGSQMDIRQDELAGLKEKGVYFPYKEKIVTKGQSEDKIHILTISKDIYQAVMPDIEDLAWLTHAKFVNLSATEDSLAEQDGWFSTIIANRFIPSNKEKPLKSTIHLISADGYLNSNIPNDCNFVRFISIFHWNVYSEKIEDKSFVSLVNGLNCNSGSMKEEVLKPHYLRTGEKTFSTYHSPLLPFHSKRYDNMNGEEKYTADGRLIYDDKNGIFDVSYSAAFNLGRLITLSRRSEAEEITAWRKAEMVKKHLTTLNREIGLSNFDLKELCKHLTEEKLL